MNGAPAELDLDTAIRNYAQYRTDPEEWMLSRFICPAPRLEALGNYVRTTAEAQSVSTAPAVMARILRGSRVCPTWSTTIGCGA